MKLDYIWVINLLEYLQLFLQEFDIFFDVGSQNRLDSVFNVWLWDPVGKPDSAEVATAD